MKEMLMPGDRLATNEEYMPGEGTYERGGVIFAAIAGYECFDEKDKVARVSPVCPSRTLRLDDIILGEVDRVSNSVVKVRISGLDRRGESTGMDRIGAIHVSRMMEDYVKEARHHFRIGDYVRARVVQLEPSIQLSTDAEELGILKARCLRCRGILSNKDGELFCPTCDRTETRKTAGDFHRFTPYFED